MLRISGSSLDVDDLLSVCDLAPDRVWRRGAATLKPSQLHSANGAQFLVSDLDLDDFHGQVAASVEFLEQNGKKLLAATTFAGVESAVLDFGVSLSEDDAARFCHFPRRLVELAASLALSLELSCYKCSASDEA